MTACKVSRDKKNPITAIQAVVQFQQQMREICAFSIPGKGEEGRNDRRRRGMRGSGRSETVRIEQRQGGEGGEKETAVARLMTMRKVGKKTVEEEE